ncbi:DUF4165 domain-containing protein [Escherichia coli]|nr:DUF4165 domain-containing protein [Escherichia coli]EGZ0692624.1 DUF4165 domain-containing protein [Escherichia coli]EGZ1119713.1 DUF4165 domain-containing protein [Escherichia coli]EGZ2704586.1 DUF4165 domain-containing protein [Escherichia coli]EGZ2737082.1 DUF4165 domain-containing protein [Escherichia coli]
MLGALAVLTAGAAHAELLEYTFKAPDGTQRSLTPNANYANPTGNISFALSAGIDRKVKISVLRSDGTVVSTATSHLLGATDRITVGGKSYYGAELQLPAPVGGAYTIRAEILASDGSTVQTDEYPLTVDVTPPTYSSLAPVYSNYGQVTSGDVWKLGLGGSEDNAFLLSGISDESPIKGVKAKLRVAARESKAVRRSLIDKLEELQQASTASPAIPQTLPEALRLAAELAEQKMQLEQQLVAAAPKVDFADRVSAANGILIGNFAKVVGLKQNALFAWLRENGILIASGGRKNVPFQQYINAGYFTVKEVVLDDEDGYQIRLTPQLTGKGQQWLTRKLLDAGVLKPVAAE